MTAGWATKLLLSAVSALPVAVKAQSYTNNYGIWDYTTSNGAITITQYTGPGGDVTIPDSIPGTTNGLPVTSIGLEALGNCYGLTSVTIPSSVTSIGDYAFAYCYRVTNVTIPNSVTFIGVFAFGDCPGLTNVTIPDSVTNIGGAAFYSCSGLTSVTIPNSVTSIGSGAFGNCSGVTNVTIPGSVTSIENNTFNGCIGLTSVAISNGVTSIGEGAFEDCSSLRSVTIPSSVTSIGDDAFMDCSGLSNVTMGKSVTNIGGYAFGGCISLKSVYFQGNAPSASTDYLVFSGDNNITIYYLPGTEGWGSTLGGWPTVPWNARVQPSSLAVRNHQLGFNITGNSNLVVVIEATSSLSNPTWQPLQTNTLNGNTLYFTDPYWTKYGSRFYRLAMP